MPMPMPMPMPMQMPMHMQMQMQMPMPAKIQMPFLFPRKLCKPQTGAGDLYAECVCTAPLVLEYHYCSSTLLLDK